MIGVLFVVWRCPVVIFGGGIDGFSGDRRPAVEVVVGRKGGGRGRKAAEGTLARSIAAKRSVGRRRTGGERIAWEVRAGGGVNGVVLVFLGHPVHAGCGTERIPARERALRHFKE